MKLKTFKVFAFAFRVTSHCWCGANNSSVFKKDVIEKQVYVFLLSKMTSNEEIIF